MKKLYITFRNCTTGCTISSSEARAPLQPITLFSFLPEPQPFTTQKQAQLTHTCTFLKHATLSSQVSVLPSERKACQAYTRISLKYTVHGLIYLRGCDYRGEFTDLQWYIPYSLKFLRVKYMYFAVLPISKLNFHGLAIFQPRLASVMNLKFRGGNFLQPFPDPRNQ